MSFQENRDLKDETGYQTLEVIAAADKFNRWMFETVRSYCHGNILEMGSGIGNISRFFVENGYSITLSDNDHFYIEQLRKNFPGSSVISLDFSGDDFREKNAQLFQTFDTIVFLNVLEHIQNDGRAIENCWDLLKPGGSMVVLVPAYNFLFSKMDRELHHFRRYTAKTLVTLVSKKRFIVEKVFYFNAMGILAWAYGKFFGLHSIPSKKMRFFNNLVPLAKLIDKISFKKAGLSVIMVARKDL